MPPLARDPTTLYQPPGPDAPNVVALPEITLLRHPGERSLSDVLANRSRRHLRDWKTGERIETLSLPPGAVWVRAADDPRDLARSRADHTPSLDDDDLFLAPVLTMSLADQTHRDARGTTGLVYASPSSTFAVANQARSPTC
jgi:hypothetical protein